MPIPWLLGAAALLVGGALVVSWWDELRSAVYGWLEARGFPRAARAFIVIEGWLYGGARRALSIVRPSPYAPPVIVHEQWVNPEDLPEELRASRGEVAYELELPS
jgi:hypothetical protein